MQKLVNQKANVASRDECGHRPIDSELHKRKFAAQNRVRRCWLPRDTSKWLWSPHDPQNARTDHDQLLPRIDLAVCPGAVSSVQPADNDPPTAAA